MNSSGLLEDVDHVGLFVPHALPYLAVLACFVMRYELNLRLVDNVNALTDFDLRFGYVLSGQTQNV